ncbi:MAG: fibronectin type III domain-containing protein, partial [Moraxellaceae bacterium]|nr:fibronectin type III domain-containing protein [Moraxellaceae bacterium]
MAFIIPLTPTTTELNVSWQTAIDDKTAAAQLDYTLHLLEGNADFIPSTSTQKFKAKNSTSTKITGLKAQTTYQLKLVVTDGDGLSTTSHVSFTTQSLPNAAPTNVALKSPLAKTASTITATWNKATDDTT